jgi:hypothetical protein
VVMEAYLQGVSTRKVVIRSPAPADLIASNTSSKAAWSKVIVHRVIL